MSSRKHKRGPETYFVRMYDNSDWHVEGGFSYFIQRTGNEEEIRRLVTVLWDPDWPEDDSISINLKT